LKINVNGEERDLGAVDGGTPLLWVLRDQLNLTGTKYGCGRAQCGACTVHVNGEAVRSCSLAVRDAAGKQIVTIEAVSGRIADAVRAAWQRLDVAQCGYCQSGQIMTAIKLLASNRKPTDADIDAAMDGSICRCGAYIRIRKAIHQAARALA
jgi:isoquinoline 1-oxidoreductase alpha subunit